MNDSYTSKNECMEHLILCTGHQIVMNNIIKASDCYLYDSDNKKYIDFEAGVWCTSLGHGHPRINQVIQNQIKAITHTGFCYLHPIMEDSAQHILDILEIKNGKCVFLCSGSEAVEFGIQVIKEQDLIEKCRILGSHFKDRLQQLQKQFSIIKDIRGRGLMLAIEFEEKGNQLLAPSIQQQLLSKGFIVANRPGFNVIRIDPPLTVSKKQIDLFIENLQEIMCQYIR